MQSDVSETQVREFMRRYPSLQRMDVLRAVVRAGPQLHCIDAQLQRMHAEQLWKCALAARAIRSEMQA